MGSVAIGTENSFNVQRDEVTELTRTPRTSHPDTALSIILALCRTGSIFSGNVSKYLKNRS